jgi:hypothetical protein
MFWEVLAISAPKKRKPGRWPGFPFEMRFNGSTSVPAQFEA